MTQRAPRSAYLAGLLLLMAAACFKSQEIPVLERRVRDGGSDGASGAPAVISSSPTGSGASGASGPPSLDASRASSICDGDGYCAPLSPSGIREAEILFAIDNSASMGATQAALRAQFPKLIQTLASGQRTDGSTFPAFTDLHLGVVSVDMGLVGVAHPAEVVESLCQDDLGPAMDGILGLIAKHGANSCLPSTFKRRANGEIECDLIVELPAHSEPGVDSPIRCSDRAYLSPVKSPRPKKNGSGGVNCSVAQLPVTSAKIPSGDGFYYDDFSDKRSDNCSQTAGTRSGNAIGLSPSVTELVPFPLFIDCDADASK